MASTLNADNGVVSGSAGLKSSADSSGVLALQTNGTTAVTVDTAQNVGVGVTPSAWGSPFTAIDMGNSSFAQYNGSTTIVGYNSYADKYKISSAGAGKYQINGSGHSWNIAGSGTAGNAISFTQAMTLDSSGNLLMGRTDNPNAVSGGFYSVGTYNLTSGVSANVAINANGLFLRATSSLKYKNNIQDATYGLADVLKLRAVTYKSNREEESALTFGGLVAEEVHEAGLTEFVQYAEDGTPDALAYGNMVSLAFKAIQEQQAIIQTLIQRVEALEGAK